ncbi:GntR family transcriptional regulator [Paracoccus laeviglucosivorans]|uniref:Transcriptional regulator, GntR family n=1 Tax=Paracoccus laeviglucosivorans TaxID=1197861 RepID=A0A521EM04_9RHOB|nr:GntR family transcriptional regulator [Paracoccus laeviglucosivorans]SMO84957.1 transcriptional regulator, GntR family [Paracoccus laeviglucosivorans]
MQRKQTLAEQLRISLRTAILSGAVEPGTVLTETPLARLVGSSRVPVRRALQDLLEEGLIHRTGPHGHIVGKPGVQPLRLPLDQALAALSILHEPRISFAWQALYDDVEARIVHRSFFGRARVNELELARHYDVGRTVARDVLSQLETRGLIDKDDALRWSVVALDERRIRELYELREHLEPLAIAGALDALGDGEIDAMQARHEAAWARYSDISAAEMYDLEVDLHVNCVQRTRNRELARILQRTHCLLTLSKHTVGTRVAKLPMEAFFEEHIAVFTAMRRRDPAAVEQAVRRHIRNSVANVVARAQIVLAEGRPEPVAFIGQVIAPTCQGTNSLSP